MSTVLKKNETSTMLFNFSSYSCGLLTATIEYSCPSVCLSLFLCVFLCVRVCSKTQLELVSGSYLLCIVCIVK